MYGTLWKEEKWFTLGTRSRLERRTSQSEVKLRPQATWVNLHFLPPPLSPPQRDYGPDCRLIERIEENKYNTYASAVWRHKNKHMFIGMTANGKIINAKKGRRRNINCHFLPLMVQPR